MLQLFLSYKVHVAGFTVENCKIVLAISKIKYANSHQIMTYLNIQL